MMVREKMKGDLEINTRRNKFQTHPELRPALDLSYTLPSPVDTGLEFASAVSAGDVGDDAGIDDDDDSAGDNVDAAPPVAEAAEVWHPYASWLPVAGVWRQKALGNEREKK